MPKFSYTAIDASGKQKSGVLSASSSEDATAQIKSMGLFVTNLVASDKAAKGRARGRAAASSTTRKKPVTIGKIIKEKGLAVFTRQLSTLLQAGLPLLRSLEVLVRQEKNPGFKYVVEEIAENVRSGNTFSDGLLQHPKVFNRLYVNMVKAGEAGGVLDVVLNRLARFMEKSIRIKGKVKSAMVYPIIVLCIAIGILAFLMAFVVPKFEDIFADLLEGAELPILTQIVMKVSYFVRDHFLMTVVGAVIFFIILKILKSTRQGARAVDKMMITLPPVGDLFRKAAIARFSRTFGTLLSSGVPILNCLTITRDTIGNRILMDAIEKVHDRVKEGDSVSAPLEASKVFPTMVTSMIDVGEETGELPEMLNRIADTYDEEVDNAVAALTSIIEPIMIVILAFIVGVIVIALFLPIIRVIENLSSS